MTTLIAIAFAGFMLWAIGSMVLVYRKLDRCVKALDAMGGKAQPLRCNGCDRLMLRVNAWMHDGCPCNGVLGINDGLQCPKCHEIRAEGSCACRTNSAGRPVREASP